MIDTNSPTVTSRPPATSLPLAGCRGRRRRGLTLIEVLATMVLIGIVLPSAMQGISMCTSAASLARQRTEAAGLAESKLNELLATGEWQFGATSGDFGEAWPGYQWAVGTSEFSDPTLQQLSIRVSWNSRGLERDVVLSTLVYQSQSTAL